MSTISTVVVKEENGDRKERNKSACFTTFVTICLWSTAALITAAQTNVSPNATGIAVSITTQDVLSMLITTWLLTKGLNEYNYFYVIPWLLLSVWSMHSCQYKSIIKMLRMLKVSRVKELLPWATLTLNIFSLLIRGALTFRVAKLAVYQWYQKSIEKEILAQ